MNKWISFQIDINSYGFAQIRCKEDWVNYVREAERIAEEYGGTGRGSDGTVLAFILESSVAAPHDVDLVQFQARLKAYVESPGSLMSAIGYGIRSDRPSFGYRREHQGLFTLEQWASTVGIDLRQSLLD